jgi:hypothetical protein
MTPEVFVQYMDMVNVETFHKKAAEAVMNTGAFFYQPYYDWTDMIYSRSGYYFECIKKSLIPPIC